MTEQKITPIIVGKGTVQGRETVIYKMPFSGKIVEKFVKPVYMVYHINLIPAKWVIRTSRNWDAETQSFKENGCPYATLSRKYGNKHIKGPSSVDCRTEIGLMAGSSPCTSFIPEELSEDFLKIDQFLATL